MSVRNEFGVEVGDFFVSSWGYDQTNVDFYKVVGLTAKGVKVQKWTTAIVGESGGPHEAVVPGDEPATYTDWDAVTEDMDYWEQQEAKVERPMPVLQKRLKSHGSTISFTVNSYSNAYKWDGKPEHKTGTGWGH